MDPKQVAKNEEAFDANIAQVRRQMDAGDGPRRFRKKPVVIEAWQNIKGAAIPDWLQGRGTGESGGVIIIVTLEGTMRAEPGDWVIKGVQDEVYPCKPDIFEQTYEPAHDH